MFENKVIDKIAKVYFFAVAVLMYYFITEFIMIGVGFSYRHLFALLMIFSAFIYFLIKPDVARAVVSVKSSLILSVPLFVVLVVSLFIWTVNLSDFDTILRGLSTSIFLMNWMSSALAAGVMLYVFGEKGIWYNLGAILTSNLIMIAQVMIADGVGVYMTEFLELIKTFADTTGEVIVKAEIHELAFCLGVYLVYMLIRPKKKVWFWVLFALMAFCYLSAFKRIAMIAVAVAVVLAILLSVIKKFSEKVAAGTINGLLIILAVALVAYVGMTRAGIFTAFENSGMNTMGRGAIYEYVKEYYEFSPSFIGNGIGFLSYQLNEGEFIGVNSIHNDFLQLFIDLGFWGYILWVISMTFVRTRYFGKKNGAEGAIIAFTATLYLFLTSTTDNTINYPLVITAVAIIIMGHGYDKQVEEYREKNRKCRGIEI